jgi:hypothetical protein
MSTRRQHSLSSWDQINANAGKSIPWWDYFQIYVNADGSAEVFDKQCERPDNFASLDEALAWATDTARALIAREVMES